MYSPRYTRVIKLSKSSSSMLSGSAANFRTVVAVPIFVHVSPLPSPSSPVSRSFARQVVTVVCGKPTAVQRRAKDTDFSRWQLDDIREGRERWRNT